MRTILTTVADDRAGRKNGLYGETQDFIESLFRNSNFGITDYHKETWETIKGSPFYMANKALLDDPDAARNGRAYKPYCIHQALLKIQDGDYCIYTDCSPEMWEGAAPGPDHSLETLHANCDKAGGILTAFVKWDVKNIGPGEFGIHTHRLLTTNSCMDTMGLRFYEDAYMPAGGLFVIRKSPETMAFVEKWLHWNCDARCSGLGDPTKPGDTSYWEKEIHLKTGHRHDQSISGLLLAEMGWKSFDIRYNSINPYNFLQYALPGELELIPLLPSLSVGDYVFNRQGVLMKVWRIDPGEKYVVGKYEQSCYNAKREDLKLVVRNVLEFTDGSTECRYITPESEIPVVLADVFDPAFFFCKMGVSADQLDMLILNNADCKIVYENPNIEDFLPVMEKYNYKMEIIHNTKIPARFLHCTPIIVPYAHKKID